MTKTLKVLSIDFTFFQNVNVETIRTCYPDGHKLTTNMSRFVWSSYYANPASSEQLESVTARNDILDSLKQKLSVCADKNIPILVSTDHADIYDFVKDIMSEKQLIKLDITNIDMYHDIVNANYELDCGNWLKFLSDEYDVTATWIAHPISKELLGLSDPAYKNLPTDFSKLDTTDVDAVFLCRNDSLLPPLLDSDFDKLLRFMCSIFTNIRGERAVKSPRMMSELIDNQKRFYKLAAYDGSLDLSDRRINYLRHKSTEEIENELSRKTLDDVVIPPAQPMMTDEFATMFNTAFNTNIPVEKHVSEVTFDDMDMHTSAAEFNDLVSMLPSVDKIKHFIDNEASRLQNDTEGLNRIVTLNNAFAELFNALTAVKQHNYDK